MAGTIGALELAAGDRLGDPKAVVVVVDGFARRKDYDIGADAFHLSKIGLEGPRVGFEVGGVVVLGRVDEDRDHHAVVLSPRSFDQAQMPVVERTHGRRESDRVAPLGNFAQPPARRGDVAEHLGHL